jgi:hypothetical protein
MALQWTNPQDEGDMGDRNIALPDEEKKMGLMLPNLA